jgi:hypothetical protein
MPSRSAELFPFTKTLGSVRTAGVSPWLVVRYVANADGILAYIEIENRLGRYERSYAPGTKSVSDDRRVVTVPGCAVIPAMAYAAL